ncbi:MAG: hypothetical protein MRY49_03300 [Candidatus Pacebacteria bacterium]|nr:hypothetical protein [Candidatus Paceibacterota bacterium]
MKNIMVKENTIPIQQEMTKFGKQYLPFVEDEETLVKFMLKNAEFSMQKQSNRLRVDQAFYVFD